MTPTIAACVRLAFALGLGALSVSVYVYRARLRRCVVMSEAPGPTSWLLRLISIELVQIERAALPRKGSGHRKPRASSP
jgi:hypothetical protein